MTSIRKDAMSVAQLILLHAPRQRLQVYVWGWVALNEKKQQKEDGLLFQAATT